MSDLIELQSPAKFCVTISPDALAKKRDAIELAQSVVQVTNAQEQQDAVAAAAILKGLTKAMEETRTEIKKPVLEAGRQIDALAKGYSDTINAELKRVERLAGDYQAKVNAAIEAERQRELADMEAARQGGVTENLLREQAARTIEINQRPTVAGASVRQTWDYEILDARVLYAARPDLFDLVPKRSLILASISIPNAPALPGLRAFPVTKVQAKALA